MTYNFKRILKLSIPLLLVLLVGAYFAKNPSKQTFELIKGHDWSHVDGVQLSGQGLTVSPTNRKIISLDGSGSQPNPAVNLSGPSISFKGDFTLNLQTEGFKNGDSVRIYGGVPIVYDEWRYEPPSIELTKSGNTLVVSEWDGTSSKAIKVAKYALNSNPKNITFDKSGNNLKISVDERHISNQEARTVFERGKLWLGFSVSAGGQSYKIRSIQLEAVANQVKINDGLTTNKPKISGSKNITSDYPKIGAAVAINPLLTDMKYRDIALSNFTIWTPENELKPQFVHPAQNSYSFSEADLLVNTALANNIAIHGHALVFGEANPAWMNEAPNSQKQQIMTDHISAVVSHYKNRVNEWDVVNEPLSESDSDYSNGGNGLRRHMWYDSMGPDYVRIALTTAKTANPDAKLFINDYGLETDGPRWDAMLNLVDSLRAQGAPLDGIGFEAHIHEAGDRVNPDVLKRHMQQLADRGLSARISEIDVFGDDGTSQQAEDYASVLKVCQQQTTCAAYSMWGISDRYGSTTDQDQYPLSYGNDLVWDSALKPKPAFVQIKQLLRAKQ